LQRILSTGITMQKTGTFSTGADSRTGTFNTESSQENQAGATANRISPKGSQANPKFNRAYSIINRAIAQSRICGNLFAPANSKLCFALLTSFYAAQNHLPHNRTAMGETHSEVARFTEH